jgi:hypothetical protein
VWLHNKWTKLEYLGEKGLFLNNVIIIKTDVRKYQNMDTTFFRLERSKTQEQKRNSWILKNNQLSE